MLYCTQKALGLSVLGYNPVTLLCPLWECILGQGNKSLGQFSFFILLIWMLIVEHIMAYRVANKDWARAGALAAQ